MNINLLSYRLLVKQMKRLADAQERLAAVAEARALHDFNYVPRPLAKLTDEEKQVDVMYTDEEQDLVRELQEKMGKRAHDGTEEEVL